MTAAEIAQVPAQAQAHPVETDKTDNKAWTALVRRCVLVPLVVLIPLITLTPAADHRFNVYANGGQYASHPFRLLRTAFTCAAHSTV